ncbi:DUF4129 domain-containing protein [Kitasatospora sp. NPDC058201]|uniref:DUF4129 domain-containing protein n=1 Tax=unclassified Kitasatospora TaxID=2633591 RepID=UPI003659B4BF
MNDDAARNARRSGQVDTARPGTGQVSGVVLVVAGLLLAAAALRPDGGLLGTAATGPVGTIGWVVLLALGWVVLVGRYTSRLREEVRHLTGPTPWAERLRACAVTLLTALVLAVPVLMMVLHVRARPEPVARDLPQVMPTTTMPPGDPAVEAAQDDALHGGVLALLGGILVLVLLAALVVAVARRFGRLRFSRRPRPGAPLPAAPPRPGDVLALALVTGRRALVGDDARAAVIACYAAMEGSLAVSGVSRRDCDSPTELLDRAVSHDGVDPFHTRALTALFREARYSTHPMDDTHVQRARTALDAVAAGLENRAAAPSGPTGPNGPNGPGTPVTAAGAGVTGAPGEHR